MICDSHAHLHHAAAFDSDRAEVLARARAAGVGAILDVATTPEDARAVVAFAAREPHLFAAVGVHPHEAEQATPEALAELTALAAAPRVIAWGEIGLDYHYMHAPLPVQREAFAAQLRAAAAVRLPVSVHSRAADADTVELIAAHAGSERGVIHCFSGDAALAAACLDLGFYLSFSGILTFRNADALRAVAANVPEDRLLVETDSPFLAPAPRRGGRNEPSRVTEVLAILAGVRGTEVERLAERTTANFFALFGRAAAAA